MKLVNPIGRTVSKLETGADLGGIMPRGCICSSGQAATGADLSGSCYICACECEHGDQNKTSNKDIAKYERVYINY